MSLTIILEARNFKIYEKKGQNFEIAIFPFFPKF